MGAIKSPYKSKYMKGEKDNGKSYTRSGKQN